MRTARVTRPPTPRPPHSCVRRTVACTRRVGTTAKSPTICSGSHNPRGPDGVTALDSQRGGRPFLGRETWWRITKSGGASRSRVPLAPEIQPRKRSNTMKKALTLLPVLVALVAAPPQHGGDVRIDDVRVPASPAAVASPVLLIRTVSPPTTPLFAAGIPKKN